MEQEKTNGESITVLPDYIVSLLDTVADQEGFSEYAISFSKEPSHSDSDYCLIIPISLVGKRIVDDVLIDDKLSLLCKLQQSDEVVKIKYLGAWKREIYIYNSILPEFVEFQRERGISSEDGFFEIPKVYAVYSDEPNETYAIIIEDVITQGFNSLKVINTANYDHAKLLLAGLGKFHAVSFALRDQKADIFKEYQKMEDVFINKLAEWGIDEQLQNSFEQAIGSLNHHEEYRIEKMQEIKDNLLESLKMCLDGSAAEPFSVVNHGDFWNKNIMFSYDEKRNPQQFCLIDWKSARYASPVLDIVHFIFSSTDKNLREEHYQQLLQIYHKSLLILLTKLGSDADAIFPYKKLQAQLKKFGKYGLIIVPMVMQALNGTAPDANTLHDLNNNSFKNEKLDLFNIRIADVIRDCIRLGYY